MLLPSRTAGPHHPSSCVAPSTTLPFGATRSPASSTARPRRVLPLGPAVHLHGIRTTSRRCECNRLSTVSHLICSGCPSALAAAAESPRVFLRVLDIDKLSEKDESYQLQFLVMGCVGTPSLWVSAAPPAPVSPTLAVSFTLGRVLFPPFVFSFCLLPGAPCVFQRRNAAMSFSVAHRLISPHDDPTAAASPAAATDQLPLVTVQRRWHPPLARPALLVISITQSSRSRCSTRW